ILAADETIDRLIDIAEGLDLDEAVELITHLPEETRERVIDRLPPGDLAARLSYGLETAATIMTDQFIAVPASWTLTRTVAAIQDRAAKVGSVRAIYAMDDDGGLVGYLEPEDLLLHAGSDTVGQWVETDMVLVRPRLDQEEVLRVARDAGVSTIPVVDKNGRLLGGITPDELADVLADEIQEDLNIASGLDPDAGPNDSVSMMIRHRLPWLLAGLVGSTLAGVAVGLFEEQLLEAAILASFIPVVMAMAGNAGIQASQVTVSGISTGTIWHGDHVRRVLRETLTGLSNSLIVGLVLSAFIVATSGVNDVDRPAELAATATLALMVAMSMATTLGAVVPLVLKRFGADPAVATGVFIAASNDILGVSVFFIIASALYL
ncbi:MAG: magnesium transporter, partial [Actinomycetota bacterium]